MQRKSLKQGTLCSEKRFVSGVVLRRKRFVSRNFVGKHSVWTSFVVKRMQVLQNFDKSTTHTKFNPKSINPIQTPKKSNQKSNPIKNPIQSQYESNNLYTKHCFTNKRKIQRKNLKIQKRPNLISHLPHLLLL